MYAYASMTIDEPTSWQEVRMKRLLILGAGTAGTMVANKLRRRLDKAEWAVTIVDQDNVHHYQPGYLLMPFGVYKPSQIVKPRTRFIPKDVELKIGTIDRVVPAENKVVLADGAEVPYDQLVIATGTTPRPEQTPGMVGSEWRKSVHEFYTYEGSQALGEALKTWQGGRLVVHITEMPVKCPVAAIEFTFLAESFFRKHGIRDKVEITYVTPLDGAFTKPACSRELGGMLDTRGIRLETDFAVERVDEEAKTLVSYDERVVPFDLLVTVPVNMGADYVARSGLGDDLNYVPVDKHTFLAKAWPNIFALGDAGDIPTSKAGSTAHFSVDVFADNFVHHVRGEPMPKSFDGHANCFIESGDDKALLLDFNYDVEPLPGTFPLPYAGPFSLLREKRLNHLGKLMFKWVYWHLLLPGRPLPIPTTMSMSGKTSTGSGLPKRAHASGPGQHNDHTAKEARQ
jgi:sulfide:quinone oxidoreductase